MLHLRQLTPNVVTFRFVRLYPIAGGLFDLRLWRSRFLDGLERLSGKRLHGVFLTDLKETVGDLSCLLAVTTGF